MTTKKLTKKSTNPYKDLMDALAYEATRIATIASRGKLNRDQLNQFLTVTNIMSKMSVIEKPEQSEEEILDQIIEYVNTLSTKDKAKIREALE